MQSTLKNHQFLLQQGEASGGRALPERGVIRYVDG